MKLIFILFSLTIINKGCSQSETLKENISIVYTASTRGSYKQIIIENQTISIQQNREGEVFTKKCSNQEWTNILQALKIINIKNLPNIEPPSNKHQFDGSKAAILTITKGRKTYESQSFDHGNPPKEIADLVKEILSIAEKIE